MLHVVHVLSTSVKRSAMPSGESRSPRSIAPRCVPLVPGKTAPRPTATTAVAARSRAFEG
jgi:hypothetical protein